MVARTIRRGVTGAFTLGSMSGLVYYQHLEDTGADEAFVLAETRVVKNFQTLLGQRPAAPSFKVIHGDSNFTRALLSNGRLEQVLGQYRPSWFYVSPFVGSVLSVLQPMKSIAFESHLMVSD